MLTDPVLDPGRLAAVAASGLMDGPPEAAFDDLTRMAAMVVNAPFAFATIVDDTRSFWKSRFGIPEHGPKQNAVDESFCKYVVRTKRELIVGDAAGDARTRDNPSVKSMGVRAWAGYPIHAPNGDVLGSFCVVDTTPREWSNRDLEVIRTLAASATREIALRAVAQSEHVARMRAEELAHTLQQSLLPPMLHSVPGLDIAARFHPAGNGLELVGDFYDLFASRDDRWTFVVGDVCGKGIEAAKIAALARHAVGSAAMQPLSPPEVLWWLNETMLARSPSPEMFLTAVYGTLTVADRECIVRLCCAGHPRPIVRRAGGETALLDAGGPLIGILSGFAIDEVELRLAAGDTLILYTDGVDEARDGAALFGEERLLKLVESIDADRGAKHIVERIEQAVLAFSGGIASDDIAVLAVRVPPA